MARSAWRISLVAGITGLALTALPTGGVTASQAAAAGSPRPAIGDRCLIGTWHDNHGVTSTLFGGRQVRMHARGGDIDHISGSGIDHDNWRKSKPVVGHLGGHKLTERIRGVNRMRLHAARKHGKRTLTVTELGWSKASTNRYVYKGKHTTGYLNPNATSILRYRCTATTLTFRRHHTVVSTETRLSRKP
jgi:hypothetical protein